MAATIILQNDQGERPKKRIEGKQKISKTSYATCARTAGMAGRPFIRHWPTTICTI